jgi:hypothetical protein
MGCTINDREEQKEELWTLRGCRSCIGRKDDEMVGEGSSWQAAYRRRRSWG